MHCVCILYSTSLKIFSLSSCNCVFFYFFLLLFLLFFLLSEGCYVFYCVNSWNTSTGPQWQYVWKHVHVEVNSCLCLVREYYQSFFILNNKHESTVYSLFILGNKLHIFSWHILFCAYFLGTCVLSIFFKKIWVLYLFYRNIHRLSKAIVMPCYHWVRECQCWLYCSLSSFSVRHRPKANNMHFITQSCGKLSPGGSGKSVCAFCFHECVVFDSLAEGLSILWQWK